MAARFADGSNSMSRLKGDWALGIKAGDLVYHCNQGEHQMARVVEFVGEIADELYRGQIPIIYIRQPERYGVVWAPADDLELIAGAASN